MKKLVVGAAVLSAALCGFAMVGPADYVQDGLVALYDAEFNSTNAQGEAIHDAAATVWVNLAKVERDLPLPESGVTIGAKAMAFDCVTAVATDCTLANQTTPVTLETCACSATNATTYKYDLLLVSIVNRAAIGLDSRNNKGITLVTTDVADFTKSKTKFIWYVNSNFKTYAPVQRTYSGVCPVNDGSAYANGLDTGAPMTTYLSTSAAAPTGDLKVGNVNIPVVFNCIRIYNRELTEDERQHNNAVDAIRFRGADAATVSPYGYAYDANGNVIDPRIERTAGTVMVDPGIHRQWLVNRCSTGPVTFDERTVSASADQAVSFIGFEASDDASTTFLGGWWDFGGGDLFRSTATFGNRTTSFDDAVVTNVGTVHVAGTSGADNRLDLVNGAELHAAAMTLGWKNGADQRSKVTVSGGSLLSVAGKLNMSDTATKCGQITLTGNELVVSNAGSRLVVGGTFGMAQTSTEGTNGAPGGNTLLVTDNAVADLQNVNVSLKNMCNVSNRVTVSKGAQLTTEKVSCSTDASYSGFTTGNWNTFEVLDGGVWTNKGTFQMGQYQHANHVGNTLLVSNATFHSKFIGSGSGNTIAWFSGKEQRIIISGPQAKFTVEGSGDASLLFNESAAHDCELIVENGADWTLGPVTRYVYMGGMTRCALVARSGGVFRSGTSLYTGSASKKTLTCQAKDCALRVESDGTFILPSFTALGLRGQLLVDDGRLTASGTVKIGNYKVAADSSWTEVGSNCVMRLKGTHPVVTAANVTIEEKTENGMVFDLPATGYLETHACSTQAVVTASTKIAFGSLSTLTLNGAEELAAHQEEVRKNAKYVLLSAPTLTIPDEVLAAAQASLPERCKLLTRTVEGKKELVLAVSAGLGLTLIVR